jgi:hypothetical protein
MSDITLEITYQQREVLMVALMLHESRYPDHHLGKARQALVDLVAATKCGDPGCRYCDPENAYYPDD